MFEKKRPNLQENGETQVLIPTDSSDYSGGDFWVNTRTGEKVRARLSVTKTGRNDFEITYLIYLLDLFDKLGGKKYQVLKYILNNRSYDNTLMITTRELAEKAGVSRSVVHEALKMLKEAGLIKTRIGGIMINAKLMNRGTAEKEAWLMHKFEIFDK